MTSHNYVTYVLLSNLESRILLGSVSRETLKNLLDDHMKGVYEHAHQIREQQVIFHKNTEEEENEEEEDDGGHITIVSS